jgi:transcriptional regulator with XRE-family HTH domain
MSDELRAARRKSREEARSAHRAQIIARTKELREAAGISMREMSEHLGVGYEAYKKYECRTALPSDLVDLFRDAVRCTIDEFYHGREAVRRRRRA